MGKITWNEIFKNIFYLYFTMENLEVNDMQKRRK